MICGTPKITRTDTLFPYTELYRTHQYRRFGASFGGKMKHTPRSSICIVPMCACGLALSAPAAAETCGVSGATTASIGTYNPFSSTGFNEVSITRSEANTSELQSLMRISYAVFFL